MTDKNPFNDIKNEFTSNTADVTRESYDPNVIKDILENGSSIDDTIVDKSRQLMQDAISAGTFIRRTKDELNDMFFGFNETIVKPMQPKWYDLFNKQRTTEETINHPGLQDKIGQVLAGMQRKLQDVKHQLYHNGRTVRNMISYSINLEQESHISESQMKQAALYAKHLLDRKKNIALYSKTDEFKKDLTPEQRSAILFAEDKADEEMDILKTSVTTLEYKSKLYHINADQTKKMARVMRLRFSKFYNVIAQAVNQISKLQLAAQTGTLLQLNTDIEGLAGQMQEAHGLLQEHSGFMYSLQEHFATLSDDVEQIPNTELPYVANKKLDSIITKHESEHHKWIDKALNS